MTNLQDKIIKQTSFLNFKGYTSFHFKDNGVDYIIDDKQEKFEKFYEYSEFYDYKNPKQFKSSQIYYLLVWLLFWLMFFITQLFFYLLFFIVFMFLYYKYYQNFLRIDYSFLVKNDSLSKTILEELEKRIKKYKRENEFIIDETNDIDYEKIKFENLLKDQIISKQEYDDIISKLDKTSYNKYKRPNWYEIIKKLLNQKWIDLDFSIENYTFENEYLPWWVESFSWTIVLYDWDKYNFWLSWDKNATNPENKETWYYSLWDSENLKQKYWKIFFYKI